MPQVLEKIEEAPKPKITTVYLKPNMHRGLKRIALDKNTTLSDVIASALIQHWGPELEEIQRKMDEKAA